MNEAADSPCCHLEPKTVNIMDEEKKLKMEELILNKLSFKKKINISLGLLCYTKDCLDVPISIGINV